MSFPLPCGMRAGERESDSLKYNFVLYFFFFCQVVIALSGHLRLLSLECCNQCEKDRALNEQGLQGLIYSHYLSVNKNLSCQATFFPWGPVMALRL